MAFTPETFVLCSKFNLFKAHANLWIYTTQDTLADCLEDNYFQPRRNLKNQDSPEVGDVIQLIVEGSKLAYLKITAKTEKPYNITVARTFLENEANLLALITALQLDKADKALDFATAITSANKGITQAEQTILEGKIDNAANSGRMITDQGVWYAKMYSATVAPSAENGTNYADFSQVDANNKPIIVIYTRQSGNWVQTQTITPPADYDGYVPVTSKIWDIAEQTGQQGGRVLWNHTSKQFTPYPTIVSFEDVTLTGDSTVEMPVDPTANQIINLDYFQSHSVGAGRNVGDIFFTSRKDNSINGAVACDGSTYQTTNYTGTQSPGNLLAGGKLPYVSLAQYATLLAQNGSVGVFGWDGTGTTAFRVPCLTDIFVETGTIAQDGDYVAPGLPDHTHSYVKWIQQGGNNGGSYAGVGYTEVDATGSASASNVIYGNSNTVQPNTVRYRAMVQLFTGAGDTSLSALAQVAYTGSYNDLLNIPTFATVATSGSYNDLSNKPTIPAAQVQSDWTQSDNSKVDYIKNKPTLSTVATSGSYNDLSNKPAINNPTITITQGGIVQGQFSLNQSSASTVALDKSSSTLTASAITSNVITEVPQDIKLVISHYELVLQAGSKIYIPAGAGTYTEQTIASDITSSSSYQGERMYFATAGSLLSAPIANCYSGDTTPGTTIDGSFWYDTTNNEIKRYNSYSHQWVSMGCSLPIAICYGASSSTVLRIDRVFNGFGYIGNQIFMLPGLTGLAPNGRNADGTLQNTIVSLSSVLLGLPESTSTFTGRPWLVRAGIAYSLPNFVIQDELPAPVAGKWQACYSTRDNKLYQSDNGGDWYQSVGFLLGTISRSSGAITNFNTRQTFMAVDYNESDFVVAFQRPTSTNDYTWYRKYKSGWVEQGGSYNTAWAGAKSFTYPIEMSDANYTLTIGAGCPDVGGMHGKDYITAKSATGFTYTNASLAGSFTNDNFSWQVSGMAA